MQRHRPFALVVVMVSAVGTGVVAQTTPRDPHEVHRLHGDSEAYIAALEDPSRDAYQKPDEVLQALHITEGEVIADVGSGSGYFALRLARHVGVDGHVYAVDINPDMVRHLNERIREGRLLNVSTILALPNDPLLPTPVDRFLFVNVWHHVNDRPAYLALMKERLKPGGQVVIIDFHKRGLPVRPPTRMKIARKDLLNQMQEHEFQLVEEPTFLPHQYFLVFQPEVP